MRTIEIGVMCMTREECDEKLLYKYRRFDEYGLDIFINSKIYFSKTSDLNDPFDSALLPSEFIEGMVRQGYKLPIHDIAAYDNYVLNMIKNFGVYCLSKKCDNVLMWSHYADGHKGFCIGFDNDISFNLSLFNQIFWREEIEYLHTPQYIDAYQNFYSEESFPIIDKNSRILNSINLVVSKFFSVKNSAWSYEEEVRIVSEQSGVHYIAPETVKCVIIGTKASDNDVNILLDLLSSETWSHVKIYRAERGGDCFSLNIKQLDVSINKKM